MKVALGAMTGLGEVGNVLADRQRAQLLNKEKSWMNLTPQQLSARVAAATQPLSQGLTEAVGNEVQGNVAERGLAQAPGIFQSILAQSLAPYYQQNQNTALQEILAQMQAPIQAGSLVPGQTDMSPLLMLLLSSLSKPTTTATGGAPVPPGTVYGPTQPPPTVPSSTTGDAQGSNWFGDLFSSPDFAGAPV